MPNSNQKQEKIFSRLKSFCCINMYNVLSKNIQFICTCTSFRNVEKSKSNVNLRFFFLIETSHVRKPEMNQIQKNLLRKFL